MNVIKYAYKLNRHCTECDTLIKDVNKTGRCVKHRSEDTNLQISKTLTGKTGPWLGKKRDKNTIEKMNLARLTKPSYFKGMTNRYTPAQIQKIRDWMTGRYAGDKNPAWKGGKSFEEYGVDFNKSRKRYVRDRDNHTCQECHCSEKELGYTLTVHHIDFNKKNNDIGNLISLCRSCHGKTQWGREKWIDYYKNKMEENHNV